jgi:hypothetical protein
MDNFSILYNYLIDEHTFDRIVSYSDTYPFADYDTFMEFNKNCINELNDKEKDWLCVLCLKFGKQKVNLVDEENCVEMKATNFYFNMQKEICIVNPR